MMLTSLRCWCWKLAGVSCLAISGAIPFGIASLHAFSGDCVLALLTNGAGVSVASNGEGSAGDLIVRANDLTLDRKAFLSGETASENGGNITLRSQDLLLLRRNSQISATAGTAQAAGNGGNITITAPFIVAVPEENSDITANAFTGNGGGTVQITAQGIFGLTPRSRTELQTLLGTDNPSELDPSRLPSNDITAISQTDPSLSGQVTLNTPNVNPTQGLVALPTELVDASRLIATSCGASDENEFIVTGSGGLPPNPSEALDSNAVQVNLVTPNPEEESGGEEEQG